ncbi:hypothetical protein PSPO01_14589 [Paraphaeosphaeria sporulosa]
MAPSDTYQGTILIKGLAAEAGPTVGPTCSTAATPRWSSRSGSLFCAYASPGLGLCLHHCHSCGQQWPCWRFPLAPDAHNMATAPSTVVSAKAETWSPSWRSTRRKGIATSLKPSAHGPTNFQRQHQHPAPTRGHRPTSAWFVRFASKSGKNAHLYRTSSKHCRHWLAGLLQKMAGLWADLNPTNTLKVLTAAWTANQGVHAMRHMM